MRWTLGMLQEKLFEIQQKALLRVSELRESRSQVSKRYDYDWEVLFEASGWTPRELRDALEKQNM